MSDRGGMKREELAAAAGRPTTVPSSPAVLHVLARCRWFENLDAAAWREVLGEGVLVTSPKGKHLFCNGDQSSDVYVVLSGRVGINTTGVNGREVGFREHGPGDAFGEIAAIDGKPRSATAKALVASQLFRIPATGFRRLLASHPPIAAEVLLSLARLVRLLSERVADNGARAVVRIVAGIANLAEEAAAATDVAKVIIRPAPTDEEMAARYDSHREAVNRVVGDLKRRGLIARARSSLEVLDLPGLRRHLDELRR